MPARKIKYYRPWRRGAVVVEFAFLLPFLFLFFLGFIEVSRVLLLQHSIDTAAYEGARSAMVPGASADEAIQAASELCETAQLKGYAVEVDPPVLDEKTSFITVKVSLPVDENATGGSFYFSSKVLVSSVTLMCERPPMIQLTGIPILAEIVEQYQPPPPPAEPEPEPQQPEPPAEPEPQPQPEPEPEPVPPGDSEVTEPTPTPSEPEPTPVDPPQDPPPSSTPNPGLPVYRY